MGRSMRFVPFLIAMTLLAACGESGSNNPVLPSGPRFDGGWTVGGNATPPPPSGETTSTSTSSTDTEPAEPTLVDSTGTERGGWTVGGN